MDPLYIRIAVLEHLSLTTISFKTPKRPWVQNRELQFSILLRLKFKLRWPRKLGLIEWRITSSFPLKLNWKKKTINFSNRIFYACYEKIPKSSIYHCSCLLSGQSVTIKCVTFFFICSSLCLIENLKRVVAMSSLIPFVWGVALEETLLSLVMTIRDAYLLKLLFKDLISTCSKLKVRWSKPSKNSILVKVIHG